MLNISIDLATGLAKLSQATVIKAGGGVPVTLTFSANPGSTPAIELALSPQSSTPAVKAYLDVFATQSQTVYTGMLDANDTRLIAHLVGKQAQTLDCEVVVTTTAGGRQAFANFPVSVQPPIITGPETTEGGPVYVTSTALQTALDLKLDDTQASTFGLSLLDDADAATARTTLGAVATTSGTAANLTLTGTTTGAEMTLSGSNTELAKIGKKGADIASASTIDLGAATGQFVDITGSATIASLGTAAAGVTRYVRFIGAVTVTHNATSLILPTAASISPGSGESATFVSLGSGNWICSEWVGVGTRGSTLLIKQGAILPSNTTIGSGTPIVSIGGNADVPAALTVAGSTTLGDAAGDSATINAGTVTAPNATSVASGNNIINLTTQDARFGPASVIAPGEELSLRDYFMEGGSTSGTIAGLDWSLLGTGAFAQLWGNNGWAVFGLMPASSITSALACATLHMPNTGSTGSGWFIRSTARIFTMVTKINASYAQSRNRSAAFIFASQPSGILAPPQSVTPANSFGVRYIMPSQAAWVTLTAYAVGYNTRPGAPNGLKYICTTAGTSGGAEPTWPTTIGATVMDGSVTWTCAGADGNASHLYEFFVTGADPLVNITTGTSTVAASTSNAHTSLSIRTSDTGVYFSVAAEAEVFIASTTTFNGTPAFIVRNDSAASATNAGLAISYFGFYSPNRY